MSVGGFVGRVEELARLDALLGRVGDGRSDLPGVAVMLRGRRRVGKSRLVQVFRERAAVPSVFFQASQGADPATARAAFVASVADSDLPLPGRDLFSDDPVFPTWPALFRQLAAALPADSPSIVVIDNFPWLLETVPELEGMLQHAWDATLAHKPVLLVLIGSDLAVMERLDEFERPFHQRGTAMVLPALNPAEVGSLLGLPAAEAIDAYLVTGGLPLICQEWEPGASVETFLGTALADPTSALLVSGERALAAEFPSHRQARTVLAAVGNGDSMWSGIRAAMSAELEPMSPSSLTNALRLLVDKRLIAADTPLSRRPAEKNRRYRVGDPYLSFYLTFLAAGLPLVERGNSDLLLRKVRRSWDVWRGRAIQPVIWEALLRLAPDLGWPRVHAVGGWWNRQNNPEIHLVGTDRAEFAELILFAGRIIWEPAKPFERHDFSALARDVSAIPGFEPATELIAVSRAGVAADLPVRPLGPDDLIAAWDA